MKKLLLVCCIALGVSTLAKAQGGGGRPPQTPETMTDRLNTAVMLTDAQKPKVMAIYKMQIASQDSLTKAGGDRTAMGPIRARYTAMIKTVLTPDQVAKMPPAGGRGGGGMGGGGGTPPPPLR